MWSCTAQISIEKLSMRHPVIKIALNQQNNKNHNRLILLAFSARKILNPPANSKNFQAKSLFILEKSNFATHNNFILAHLTLWL
jgi:hypothetical protein